LIGDCYFLAAVASLVPREEDLVRHSVIELGDGTYAVRFHKNGAPLYVRVDNDLVTWNTATDPVYAELGPEESMWVAVMEKAYTVVRRGDGTYESIHNGLPSEGYVAMGMGWDVIRRDFTNPVDVIAQVKGQFEVGRAMSWVTSFDVPAGIPLLASHAYAIVDGAGNVDGADDGYVTITAQQARTSFVNVFYGFA
jgi:hypothetical protein